MQVAVTCGEEVYDYAAALQLALQALQARAASDPNLGRAFALSGQIALNVTGITSGADNTFTLNIQARGLWVYAFSTARLRQLAAQIAGKSAVDARALLLQQAGIADAQFSTSSTLPANLDEIRVVLKQLSAPS